MTDQDLKIFATIRQLFTEAGIPCAIAQDIKKQMWLKFLVNCSYNGISAIGGISNGDMVAFLEVRNLIDQITKEFLLIAHKEGVGISECEAREANESIAKIMATQISSTAQDLGKGRETEINYWNGYIVALGKRYGIEMLCKLSVCAMVKLLESQIQSSALD